MDCSICFDNIDDKNKISLACSHMFHKDCIESWIHYLAIEKNSKYNIKYNCPYCRKNCIYNKSTARIILSRLMSLDIYLNIIIYYTIIMILLLMKLFL